MLPTYNKFWFPFDEGLMLTATDVVMHGGIPYKDFAMPYGALQFYILSCIFKIFGTRIEIAHISIIFFHTAIAAVVFYLTYKISKNVKYAIFIWLVAISCLAPRMGSVVFSIWSFVVFFSLSMPFFVSYIHERSNRTLLISSLFTTLAFLSRYELGAYFAVSQIFIIFLAELMSNGAFKKKILSIFTKISTYLTPMIILGVVFVIYLWKKGALDGFIFSMLMPYKYIIKYSISEFPKPCFNPWWIFHGSLRFIDINQNYISVLAYAAAIPVSIYLYMKRRIQVNDFLTLLFITCAGISIMPYAYYAPGTLHTLPVIFPALIISGFFLKEGFDNKDEKIDLIFRIIVKVIAYIMLLLLVLLFIKNSDKYLKNAFVKPLSNKIIFLNTARGGVYVPASEIDDVREVLKVIDSNTTSSEKIFIGFDNHRKYVMGGEPGLYFLADRLPCTKYFIFFPAVFNQENIQKEIMASLKNVRLIVLSSNQWVSLDNYRNETGSGVLDDYIATNYKFYMKAGKYNIYVRK